MEMEVVTGQFCTLYGSLQLSSLLAASISEALLTATYNKTPNTGLSVARILHIKMNLSQSVFLEQVAIHLKPEKLKKGVIVSVVGLQVTNNNHILNEENTERMPEYILAPICPPASPATAPPEKPVLINNPLKSAQVGSSPEAMPTPAKKPPQEGVYESNGVLYIHCAAFTNSLQITLLVMKGRGGQGSASQNAQAVAKDVQSEDSEFDREVAMISLKTAPGNAAGAKQIPKEQKEKEEKKEIAPTKSPATVAPATSEKQGTSTRRDFETLPRYYKDTWSPDRPGYVPPPKKYAEENKELAGPTSSKPISAQVPSSNPPQLKDSIKSSNELQLSPIQKESCLEPSRNDIEDYGLEEEDLVFSRPEAFITKIILRGLPSQDIPPPSYAITLLNTHALLERLQKRDFLPDIDYLASLALFSGRRFLQASEILRKLESELLNRIEAGSSEQCLSYPSPKTLSSLKTSYSRFQPKANLAGALNQSSSANVLGNRAMSKAAKLEILIADGMNQHFQLSEKLNALKRAADLFLGLKVAPAVMSAPSKFYTEDIYTSLIKLHPHLTRLLLSLLIDQNECFKAAALRTLDFVLENMGCSLGNYVVHILKAVVSSYPNSSAPPFTHDSFNASMLSITTNPAHGGASQIGGHSDPNKISPRFDTSMLYNRKEETKKKLGFEDLAAIQIVSDQAAQSSRRFLTMYNHLLETYVSVLSSISSQILHHIFTGVILSHSFALEISPDLRAILLRIAEKIVTICQGDLILIPNFINGIMNEQNSPSEQLASAAQALWQTLRAKVFPNCSPKAKKQIVDWLFEGLVNLAEFMAREEKGNGGAEEVAVLPPKIEDEIMYKLAQYIDIAMILTAEKAAQDEGNSLVLRPKVEDRADLLMLVNPLIYWLNFTMSAEGRVELFKQTWGCISVILTSLRDLMEFDVNAILLPLLGKVNDYCKHSCPTLPMLQFLTTVLKSLKIQNLPDLGRNQEAALHTKEMQKFIAEFLVNLASHIPSFPSEEIFGVFDTLLDLALAYVAPDNFPLLISYLTDKFTIKSKKQKVSLNNLIQGILKMSAPQHHEGKGLNPPSASAPTPFDVVFTYCIIANKDVDTTSAEILGKKDSKKPMNLHEKFLEKLNFFIDLIKGFNENHRSLFCKLIKNPGLSEFLKSVISNGHSSIRLRSHEIMEILCNFLARPQEENKKMREPLQLPSNAGQATSSWTGEIIWKEQLYLGRHILNVVKQSLDSTTDSYMQFNSLILLDLMFQSILPVPTFSMELDKKRTQKKSPEKREKTGGSGIIDLEVCENEYINSEFKANEYKYLNMRMLSILKLWPYIQNSLNSPWSNIRSITYGLICSMLKVDIHDYKNSFKDKLKGIVLPLLLNLLGSKESESKAGGLNILGSLCGLSYDVTRQTNLSNSLMFFRRNSNFVSLAIWQQVFDLQEDWDSTIREAAIVLVQLSAPRDSVRHFHKVQVESKNLKMNFLAGRLRTFCKIASNQVVQFTQARKRTGEDLNSLLETLELVGRTTDVTSTGMDEDMIRMECPGAIAPKPSVSMVGANLSSQNNPSTSLVLSQSKASESLPYTMKPAGNTNNPNDSNASSFISSNEEPDESDEEYFFIDKYSDDQIKDIISIFRNDFKPPKNLWIEKNVGESQEIAEYDYEDMAGHAMQAASSTPSGGKVLADELPLSGTAGRHYQIVDILEDKLVENIPAAKEKITEKEKPTMARPKPAATIPPPAAPSANAIGKSGYIMVSSDTESLRSSKPCEGKSDQMLQAVSKKPDVRKKDSLDAEPYKFFNTDEDYNQEDLEIIDIEDEDFLGPLDSGEVPVLKNAYASKKSKRPPEARGKAKAGKSSEGQANPAPAKAELLASKQEGGKKEVIAATAAVAEGAEKKEAEKAKGEEVKNVVEVPAVVPPAKAEKEQEVKNVAEEKKTEEIAEENKEDELAASLRLKKNSNTMRPINGLRPITPPMKLPGAQPPPPTKPLPTSDDAPPTTASNPAQKKEAAPTKKPPTSSLPSSVSQSYRAQSKQLASSRITYKKAPSTSPAKLNKSSGVFPMSYNTAATTPKEQGGIRYPKSVTTRNMEPNTSGNLGSLPGTPTAYRASAVQKNQNNASKVHMQSPVVATLFKELTLNPKKKLKSKQKMPGHKELAQTSPALAAILKSLKEGNPKSAQQLSAEGEKAVKVLQSERAGKKIVLQAKKLGGVKIVQASGIVESKVGTSALLSGAKKGSVHHRGSKAPASSRTAKARIKSKSQVQMQGGPVQAINITTDQISLGVGELSGRDITPLRNNYVQEQVEGAEGEQDINQTY